MTNKALGGLCLTLARARRPALRKAQSSMAGLAAATLLSFSALGAASPAFGQDANRVGLCTLEDDTIAALQGDVAAGIGAEGDVEVAFVVVYSLNNDNHGQPVADGTTGPVLCTNPDFVGPDETAQTDQIPDTGTVDIRDSSEAFILRYEPSATEAAEAEARFCHTVNANVDCFLVGPLTID